MPRTVSQNVPLGIGLMMLAVLLFSLNDTLGKWLAASYQAPQILLFRSIFAMLVLAALFLGEKVGWRRWSAVLVGFAGVVIALQPAATHFGWQAGLALLGSIMYAIFLTVTRSLRGTPDVVMAFWQIGSSLVLGTFLTPFVFVPFVRWYDLVLLSLLGLVSLGAIICVNRSLKLAPASVVVPYQYMMIVWAVIFGYAFFGDVPAPATLIGAAIIVAAGLFIFIREQKLSRPFEPEMPPEL